MKVYWYWPFLRDELLALAGAYGATGDELVVHAMRGRVDAEHARGGGWRVEATLPAVDAQSEGTARWLASRASIYLRQAAARRRLLSAERFDVAHVMFSNYFVDAFDLSRLARHTPLVVTVHDVVPHQRRVPGPVEHALLAREYAAAPTIVVHHTSIAARLQREFAIDPSRIHDIPHWVIPAPYEQRSAPNRPATVLCFGALRPNKGVEVLLDAFAELPADVRLVVAGRGAPAVERAVRAAAARDDRVRAEIGFVPEVRKHELYRECDLVVLPYTEFSSQSGVLHDAYAHHRPAVVTDVGALGPSVRADESGWVVRPNDAAALAATIGQALEDDGAWGRAAVHAGAVGESRSPQRTADRLRRVYLGISR